VEVVHAAFACRGVAAAVVQARANATLHRLHDRLVLAPHAIESAPAPASRLLESHTNGRNDTRVRSTASGVTAFTDTPHGYTLNIVVGKSQ
jgi:hypothetical protein